LSKHLRFALRLAQGDIALIPVAAKLSEGKRVFVELSGFAAVLHNVDGGK
jgi:hypothetical protein